MKATIITIGDEILIGQIIDTNSAWISAELNMFGITVVYKCSVGDNVEAIKKSVTEAMPTSELVIITGGLGPTKDDITKHTLADMFDSNLVRDESTFQFVKEMVASRGLEFNELNQAQAMVPECCTVIPNVNGTAPGMWFNHDNGVVVSLPGVPFEMKALIIDEILPRIKQQFNLDSNIHKTILTFGLAESTLSINIAEWEDNLPKYLKLAYLPNPSGVRLRLSAYGVDSEQAISDIDTEFAKLKEIIPNYYVGDGFYSLSEAVAQQLTESKQTLSVAESCTGGAISSQFTAISGASEYFMGGVVSYSNEVKHNVLGVSNASLESYGAVSKEVAMEMAAGVRRICNTDYAIATTGIAGPGGGSDDKPVGTVWIGVATRDGVRAEKHVFSALRAQNIARFTAVAINLLRLTIAGKSENSTSEGML